MRCVDFTAGTGPLALRGLCRAANADLKAVKQVL
jgi:hypothetical protein